MSNELKFFLKFVGDGSSAVNASEKLKSALASVAKQAALTAISFKAFKELGSFMVGAAKDAGALTKELTRIRLTAEEGGDAMERMRAKLKSQSASTGISKNDLLQGYQAFAATGLSTDKINPAMDAVSKAMLVSGVDSADLANAVGAAAEAFGYDVGRDAELIIDKMYKAGKKGNANLPDLPKLISRAGFNAASAGIDMDTFLAISEQMSQYERTPARLATLMDSTMRIFTNLDYLKKAQDATGVQFFDKEGNRRNSLDVLEELRVYMSKAKTDKDWAQRLDTAFGDTDLGTQRGLRALFGDENSVNKMRALAKDVSNAAGEVRKDFNDAADNYKDQMSRTAEIWKNATDRAGKNFETAVTPAIKAFADFAEKKSDLAGDAITAAGAVASVASTVLGGKSAVGLLKGVGQGLALSKSVEKATGEKIQSVFVVNMPGSGFDGKKGLPRSGFDGKKGLPPVLPKGLSKGLPPIPPVPTGLLGGLGSLALPLAFVAGMPLAAWGISGALENDFVSKGGETRAMKLERMKFERNLAVQVGQLSSYDKGKFNPGDYGYELYGNHKYTVSPQTNVYITMSKDGKVQDTRTVVKQTTGNIR